MGAAQSTSEIKQSILNKQLFESISKTLNSITSSNNVHQETNQRIRLRGVSVTCYMGVKIANKASSSVSAMANLSSTDVQKITNDVMGKFESNLKAESAQKNSGLQIGLANNSSKMDSRVENEMKTAINNSLTTTKEQMLKVTGETNQVIEYDPGEDIWTLGTCEITNESIMATISKSVTDSVVENISSNKAVMDAFTVMDNKSTQSNEGLSMGFFGVIAALCVLLFLIAKGFRLV